MNDTISRQDAINIVNKHWITGTSLCNADKTKEDIIALSSAEPKRGEWIVNPNDGRHSGWKCNQCGFNGDSWDNFCRHCGADMRGNIK